jgi:hypothetical protein
LAFLQGIGRTTVQGNIGYAVTPGGIETKHRAIYNLSVAVPLQPDKWHAFAEFAGSAGAGLPEMVVSPGLKYGFRGGHFVAFGLPLGLNSTSPKVGAIFQVQFALRKAGGDAESKLREGVLPRE